MSICHSGNTFKYSAQEEKNFGRVQSSFWRRQEGLGRGECIGEHVREVFGKQVGLWGTGGEMGEKSGRASSHSLSGQWEVAGSSERW